MNVRHRLIQASEQVSISLFENGEMLKRAVLSSVLGVLAWSRLRFRCGWRSSVLLFVTSPLSN